MPPQNVPGAAAAQPGARRPPVDRIVPAIPLMFTKPKQTKPKPKVESSPKGGEDTSSITNAPSMAVLAPEAPQEQTQPVVNGDSSHAAEGRVATPFTAAGADEVVQIPVADTPGSRGSAAMSLSFGSTPDIPAAAYSPPTTTPPQVQPQVPLSPSSPSSSRKASEKFDVRHIRTELPPAFVPSAGQHTPKSATSSHSGRPLNFPSHAHPSHPSVNSIVFGGQDSSSSSPAPPHPAGSVFASPSQSTFQPPYYGPQTHSHHASDPQYRPQNNNYGQPAIAWNYRHSYAHPLSQGPPFQPYNGQTPFRYPQRDPYPSNAPQFANGRASRSRSGSQASSAAQERQRGWKNDQSPISPHPSSENAKMMLPPEPKAAFPPPFASRQPQFHPGMGPPPPPPPMPSSDVNMDNAEALRKMVLLSFGNPKFADCQLRITDEHSEQELSLDGHRMILQRSPMLQSLLQESESAEDTSLTNIGFIRLKGDALRTATFVDSIKYLYGGTLLGIDHQRPNSGSTEHIPSNINRMEAALQTIAAGLWLKVDAIADHAMDVATSLLHWETISTALSFALDGGLSPVWNVDEASDRASVSSSDESLSRAEPASLPTYDPYASHLLNRIVEYIVQWFPTNFYLDAAAPQLATCPRLPASHATGESRQSRSDPKDPRLSQIRFGDVPVEDHQRPSFATTIVSSILLSLPFQLLKVVLEHHLLANRLGPETVASIMRQVVAEREARRNRALTSAPSITMSNESTDAALPVIDPQLTNNLYWQESVEPSSLQHHRAGFRLARRKRDIDTPPSSGACSERNK